KKGITLKCPVCGSENFMVSDSLRDYLVPAIDKDSGFKVNFDKGLPVYSLICENCSYVLNFSIQIAETIIDGIPSKE
ncbi:hypothetical protein, partial [Ameyamaea chiangmaiensis]